MSEDKKEVSTIIGSLRIVSYNILADCYVRVPDQPWNAFSYCKDEYLSYDERCPRIVENLIQSEADIIALQEVMFEFRDDLWQLPQYLVEPLEEKGYVAVMQGLKQKEIAKNALRNERMVQRAVPTGLAVFWKCESFDEIDKSKGSSGGGMTVYLQHRDSKAVLCVNNIHLVGAPSKFDQHVNQLNGAMKQLNNNNLDNVMVKSALKGTFEFICGDFNRDIATDSSMGERSVIGQWFHDEGFFRAPTGMSWANDSTMSALDNVMYRRRDMTEEDEKINEGDSSLSVNIDCRACMPDGNSDELLSGGIPNQFHPSDHVMLQVDFEIITS